MKSLCLKQNMRNPQLHPQVGDNFNMRFKLKVKVYFAFEMAM
jgi:hypothetical protein